MVGSGHGVRGGRVPRKSSARLARAGARESERGAGAWILAVQLSAGGATACTTWSYSKYTINAGYTQRVIGGWPTRGETLASGAPNWLFDLRHRQAARRARRLRGLQPPAGAAISRVLRRQRRGRRQSRQAETDRHTMCACACFQTSPLDPSRL